MPRTFAYVRVSTVGQTTENQIQEIEAAGFKVDPRWRRHHPIVMHHGPLIPPDGLLATPCGCMA
jgi:hypothetical protein